MPAQSAWLTVQPQMAPGGLSIQLAHRAHTGAWALLAVDVAAALAAQRVTYRCIRSLQLCGAMCVRGAFTSDTVYSPKVTQPVVWSDWYFTSRSAARALCSP